MATLLFTIEAATQAEALMKAQQVAGAFFGDMTSVRLSADAMSIIPKTTDAQGLPATWSVQVQATN